MRLPQQRRAKSWKWTSRDGVPITIQKRAKSHPHKFLSLCASEQLQPMPKFSHSQELQHWLRGHVHAFTFLAVLPRSFVPITSNPGEKTNYYEPDLIRVIRNWQNISRGGSACPGEKPKDKSPCGERRSEVGAGYSRLLRNRTCFSLGEAQRAHGATAWNSQHAKCSTLGKSRRQLSENWIRKLYPRSLSIPMNLAHW